jgi:hypothetical protein
MAKTVIVHPKHIGTNLSAEKAIKTHVVDVSEVAKMQKKMTLVFHAVRFPDLAMPNKPETFGLDPAKHNKKIMSLGRMKLFPDEVLKNAHIDIKESALYKLKLIRSRLQSYIDQYTFPFMNGLARAIPNEKLAEFNSIIQDLQTQFNVAKGQYLAASDTLLDLSTSFWKKKSHDLGVSEEQIAQGIASMASKLCDSAFLFEVTHFAITSPENIEIQTMDDEEVEMLQARQEVVKASMADLQVSMTEFKHQVLIDLRVKYQEAFNSLLASLQSGKFNQKSINSVLKLMDDFKNLNIMDDKELERVIDDSKSSLSKTAAKTIKTDAQVSKEFTQFLNKKIEELSAITEGSDDFGEFITREVDPF